MSTTSNSQVQKQNLEKGWKLIQTGIILEAPTPLGLYLGCRHVQGSHKLPDRTIIRTIIYDMEPFLVSCVELYKSLAPASFTLKWVPTPFPPENVKDDGPAGNPAPNNGKVIHCPWCQESFPDHLNKALPKQPAKAKQSALLQGTAGEKSTGVLQPRAAKVLMKLLYGARLARFDLLRAINNLAAYITKWTPDCDKRLHRIMCYVDSTLKHRLIGFVGDKPCNMQPHLFADADFAGDPDTQRSTSGLHLALRGPATCFPLTVASKPQTCVSHGTPEAELVAADFAMRTSGLPAQQLWNVILG